MTGMDTLGPTINLLAHRYYLDLAPGGYPAVWDRWEDEYTYLLSADLGHSLNWALRVLMKLIHLDAGREGFDWEYMP